MVFHLAAQIDVRVSVADPVADARSNVLGTLNVLEAARAHEAQVIFASTGGAIYGECDGPASEDAPRLPLSPYGTSKLAAEEYLATWNRLYGTRHVALRLGNVYGPRQDPHGEAGVVAIFLSRIRDGQEATIYGDGSQTRDYVFSATSRGRSSARSAPRAACSTSGRARRRPSSRCGRLASRRRARRRRRSTGPARLGELQRSCLDPRRAETTLHWRAEVPLSQASARRGSGSGRNEPRAGERIRVVDHPIRLDRVELAVRPWRTATVLIAAVAAVELVLLVVVGGALLAKPEPAGRAPRRRRTPPPRPGRRRQRRRRPPARRRRPSCRGARCASSCSTATVGRARRRRGRARHGSRLPDRRRRQRTAARLPALDRHVPARVRGRGATARARSRGQARRPARRHAPRAAPRRARRVHPRLVAPTARTPRR